jgi:hypothetical protein
MMSAASALRADLSAGIPGLDKWGWVIYRTTYDDDEAWTRFRARVEEESRADVAQTDAPEIVEQLEWTWVEDRESLDGVSREELRERFRGWVDGEMARIRGESGGETLGFDPAAVPRYAFFVQIDEEALRSVAESWDAEGAHVKFVDANWRPKELSDVEEERLTEEAYDEIDGCQEHNVGWMRIVPYMLNAEFYDAWCGVVDSWHVFYKRPPGTVDW